MKWKKTMEKMFDLTGKVIVITGGGGVLGSAVAADLARAGAKVALLGRREEPLVRVASRIAAEGGAALPLSCNVLEREDLQKARDRITAQWGPADILINGAGGNNKAATTSAEVPVFDIPVEAIRQVVDLNLIGTILPTQIFARDMASRGSGVILNVSSMNAFRPLTKVPAYSAAKAAVSNFTQWLAVHVCQTCSPRIRVNAIAPGFFLTEQNRFLLTDEKTGDLTPRGRSIIDHTPMARFGAPGDLLGTVRWLISDAAQFVTGIVVPVDGGFSAYGGV